MHGKLRTWKERIRTCFYGQDAPHDMYCNAAAVLKIDSVYKEGKNYQPRYMLNSVNTLMQKGSNVTC